MEPKACACPLRHSETSELTGRRQNEQNDQRYKLFISLCLIITKKKFATIRSLYKGNHGYLPLLIISATNDDNTSYQ